MSFSTARKLSSKLVGILPRQSLGRSISPSRLFSASSVRSFSPLTSPALLYTHGVSGSGVVNTRTVVTSTSSVPSQFPAPSCHNNNHLTVVNTLRSNMSTATSAISASASQNGPTLYWLFAVNSSVAPPSVRSLTTATVAPVSTASASATATATTVSARVLTENSAGFVSVAPNGFDPRRFASATTHLSSNTNNNSSSSAGAHVLSAIAGKAQHMARTKAHHSHHGHQTHHGHHSHHSHGQHSYGHNEARTVSHKKYLRSQYTNAMVILALGGMFVYMLLELRTELREMTAAHATATQQALLSEAAKSAADARLAETEARAADAEGRIAEYKKEADARVEKNKVFHATMVETIRSDASTRVREAEARVADAQKELEELKMSI